MAASPKPIPDDVNPQSYWTIKKSHFLPGESFKNWSAYKSALSQTGFRFKNRLSNRSSDANELGEIRDQSKNNMKRCLNWWDLTWFGFGSVVGAGIFVLTGQEAHNHAGPAIVLSYVFSGLSAMLSVFCYTEFAVEVPVAGGSFAYLRIELGDFAAFIAAANILLDGILASAAVARGWTSYFTTLLNRPPNSLRIHTNLKDGYNLLDPIAVVVLTLSSALAMTSTKTTSISNWIGSAINSAVVLFAIIAGFSHGKASNLTPFLPYGAKGIFQAAAIVFFAYGGFDSIATMAEETKNPSKDIPLGLLGSMSCITVIYCLMALSLSTMQKYTAIDPNAAYTLAFQNVGLKWAKPLVALGGLGGMTTTLFVGALGQARYITHIARVHMIPPWFALVHPKTGTPIYATMFTTILSCTIAFFSSLEILSSILSISTLFIFIMMAVALLVRRYYVRGVTSHRDRSKFITLLICIIVAAVGTAVTWASNPYSWLGYAITVPCWFLATLAMSIFLPQQHSPKVWGVPFVPWLPSLSIATNVFLMGSLSAQAFLRFGICTVIMLIYYLLLGLHATYDMAQHHQEMNPKVPATLCFRAITTSTTVMNTTSILYLVVWKNQKWLL